MTTVYFVRHALPDFSCHDDRTRPLAPQGMADRLLVNRLLKDVPVDAVLSSPFLRAADTVRPLAEERGLPLTLWEDFRERKVDGDWIEDFNAFARRQWDDFDYHLPGGESLRQVRQRNIAALESVLTEYAGQTVVIGSHGTALSTIVNHYVPSFGWKGFDSIRRLMPWVVRFCFEGNRCREIRAWDVFHPEIVSFLYTEEA